MMSMDLGGQNAANNGVPRVAVIGAGYWGKNLVRNFHSLRALAVICDIRSAITTPSTLEATTDGSVTARTGPVSIKT